MSTTIDARGLSCPQPVLMTLEEINKQGKGEIQVFVDTDTSRENVGRAAENQGWEIKDILDDKDGYRVIINKD